MNHNPEQFFSRKKPWGNNENPIWLASTIMLMRNIEKFKFPGKLDSDRKKQIISLVSNDLMKMPELKSSQLLKAEELDLVQRELIGEQFLTMQTYNQSGSGEGFIVDERGELLITLNLLDHIHLQILDCKGEIENSWAKLTKIESQLGKTLNYAFLPKFGFLTADPTECGTGLVATLYLQVPGLVHSETIDSALEEHCDDSLIVSGIQGSPTEIIGDTIVVRNNYTLGVTEENILTTLRTFATKIITDENRARKEIKESKDDDYKDKVSRAYGILVHSYQIEAVEALNAISLLKLGVEAGWIDGIGVKEINELFFNCRRAHLLTKHQAPLTQEEIPHKRAEFIHKALSKVTLNI